MPTTETDFTKPSKPKTRLHSKLAAKIDDMAAREYHTGDLCALLGCFPSSIYRSIKLGYFPPPTIRRSPPFQHLWRTSDIRKWMAIRGLV